MVVVRHQVVTGEYWRDTDGGGTAGRMGGVSARRAEPIFEPSTPIASSDRWVRPPHPSFFRGDRGWTSGAGAASAGRS